MFQKFTYVFSTIILLSLLGNITIAKQNDAYPMQETGLIHFLEEENEFDVKVLPIIQTDDYGILDPSDTRLIEGGDNYNEAYATEFWANYNSAIETGRYQAQENIEVNGYPLMKGWQINSPPWRSVWLPGNYGKFHTDVEIENHSADFYTITYVGSNSQSYAYVFAEYDPDLDNYLECPVDFGSSFPDGIVIGLSSPDTTEVTFGLDSGGRWITWRPEFSREVVLDGITPEMQYYRITEEMFGYDFSHIGRMGLRIDGAGLKTLNVEFGGHRYYETPSEPITSPDPELSQEDVTALPLGVWESSSRPDILYRSELDQEARYGAESSVEVESPSQFSLTHIGESADSISRVLAVYDPREDTRNRMDHINFNEAFPDGLVLGLSSPDTDTALLLVKGYSTISRVALEGITPETQYFKVTKDMIDPAVLGGIYEIGLMVEGKGEKTLNVDWGGYLYTTSVQSDLNLTSEQVTSLPLASTKNGTIPELKLIGGIGVEIESESQITIFYDGIRHYDDGSVASVYSYATDLEQDPGDSFDFEETFPDGIVLGISSPAQMGSVINPIKTEPKLAITDWAGLTSHVLLEDITPEMQYYQITKDMFDQGIDFTSIRSIGLDFEGEFEATYQVNWGTYDYLEPFLADSSLGSEDRTPLPLVSEEDGTPPVFYSGNFTYIRPKSDSTYSISYYGDYVYTNPTSAWIRYNTFTISDSEPVNVLNFDEAFPDGMVIGLSSPNITRAEIKFQDWDFLDSRIVLGGLTPETQYFRITKDMFNNAIDFSTIRRIDFMFEGKGDKTLNVELSGDIEVKN